MKARSMRRISVSSQVLNSDVSIIVSTSLLATKVAMCLNCLLVHLQGKESLCLICPMMLDIFQLTPAYRKFWSLVQCTGTCKKIYHNARCIIPDGHSKVYHEFIFAAPLLYISYNHSSYLYKCN